MTIREFWHSTFATPRAALVCAAVAIVVNVGSYLGLTARWAGGALAV